MSRPLRQSRVSTPRCQNCCRPPGDQRWNRLFLAVGGERNGKRMTLEIVARALGEYATTIHPELLLDTHQNSISDDRPVLTHTVSVSVFASRAVGQFSRGLFPNPRIECATFGAEIANAPGADAASQCWQLEREVRSCAF